MNNPKSSDIGSGGGSGSSVLPPRSIITIRIGGGTAGGVGTSSFGTLRSAAGGVGGAITATVEY